MNERKNHDVPPVTPENVERLATVLATVRDLIDESPGHEASVATTILVYAGRALEKNGHCASCLLRGGLEALERQDRRAVEKGPPS